MHRLRPCLPTPLFCVVGTDSGILNIYMKRHEEGQAMIGSVLFVLVAGLLLSAGAIGPGVENSQDASALAKSYSSFHAAESGVEDVLYRLDRGYSVSGSESLALNDQTTQTSIVTTGNEKIVTALGSFADFFRRIQAEVMTGTGIAFNYGVQVGQGGFVLSNNAGVVGNVYSNSSITGSNGSYINGTAIAANSSSLLTDQAHDTPVVPSSSITFRAASGNQDFAQSFVVSTSSPVNKVDLYLKKVGSPSSATVYIKNDTSGRPGNTTMTSGTLNSSLVTTSYGWITVTFDSNPILVPGTIYWLVVDNSTQSASNYYTIGAGNGGYASGQAKIGQQGGTWSSPSPATLDGYFKLYLGGLYSSISGVRVGQGSTGNAHAHTVTNSTVAGALYCQTGSGNNKACNTSQADPTFQNWPVSDANIEAWKEEAEAGGTWSGSFTASSTTTQLGPRKISGDLNLSNNKTLVVNGTLWVTGNFNVSNNVQVRLGSGYGTGSGVIVVDGTISISNNATFAGSGQTGSYLMLLTTSPSDSAINVSNNAGTVILNAQRGTITFSNNAGAKEATANRIVLSNNAVITYESGLANLNFVSGPSGGWNITGWKEIE